MNKYYVVVLPMDKDGKVNRQVYEFETEGLAKKAFHANCAKYFEEPNYVECSVSVLNRTGNSIMSDTWKAEIVPTPEVTEAAE